MEELFCIAAESHIFSKLHLKLNFCPEVFEVSNFNLLSACGHEAPH